MVKPPPSPPSRAMQWAGIFILTLLTLVVLIFPLFAAYITKKTLYLIPEAGTLPLTFMWCRVYQFLYKRPEDYYLEELQIKSHATRQKGKKPNAYYLAFSN